MTRASTWIRFTHGLNVLLWRIPLPQRLQTRLSGLIYRNPPMSEERAIETLDALEREGVAVCCMGGWGVDALVGEQTRKHRDLDLIVDRQKRETALRVLAGLGYEEWYEQSSDGHLGDRVVVRDPAMRVVDLHPADLDEAGLAFTSGALCEREVICLTAEQQFRAHQQFRNRLPHERRNQRRNTEIARRVLETESGRGE